MSLGPADALCALQPSPACWSPETASLKQRRGSARLGEIGQGGSKDADGRVAGRFPHRAALNQSAAGCEGAAVSQRSLRLAQNSAASPSRGVLLASQSWPNSGSLLGLSEVKTPCSLSCRALQSAAAFWHPRSCCFSVVHIQDNGLRLHLVNACKGI